MGGLVCATVVLPVAARAQEPARQDDFLRAVGTYYAVPVDELDIISDWGVPLDEIPVLLFLAQRTGVSRDAVAAERRRGSSFNGMLRRYGVQVTAVHVPFAAGAALGGLADLYGRFESTPRGAWNRLDLSDREVTALINTRVLADALEMTPAEVLAVAEESGGFFAAFQVLVSG